MSETVEIPQTETPATSAPAPQVPVVEKVPDWVQPRLSTLTRDLRSTQETLAAIQKERDEMAARLAGMTPAPATPAPFIAPTPAAPLPPNPWDNTARTSPAQSDEARVRAQAEILMFNQECDRVYHSLVAKKPDFQQKMNTLQGAFGGFPPSVIKAALGTGEAERILYDLSSDLNEFARITSLPPEAQAVEIGRRAATAARISQAPDPITPLGNAAGAPAVLDLENCSMDDFMRVHMEEVQKYGL